ncbi:hemolysin III family protein [Octadecabacter sp. 1_MG-2023]|uniref:PAQR family membrane homeostasis protein TrhA n=1 Tax=unclassified Octadecabacter TaxID=196158 RepID=UPI001C0946DB|nr:MULTISPECIES: hemolysin III family protein [unclassified Octadecabacter]MBU2994668.1 hemolysin III family protein [Octadecabacter sp. B2R22]MDO6734038.1 hemolysin III family protein [Octadecabacter sp. 1_MG-2023]
MSNEDPYPTFTKGERIADAVMHIAGVCLAIAGTVALVIWAAGQTNGGTIASLSIYGAALIASFIASACYHFTPWEAPRHALRRIDHAAIYFKIAGTYTPLVVMIGSAFAYGVLAIVWGLATLGAVAKLFFWSRPGRFGAGLYLGLGWMSIALLTSLIAVVPTITLVLIVVGGLVYSIGAVLFSFEEWRFQNAVWHGFVLAASICFFAAIALGVTSA